MKGLLTGWQTQHMRSAVSVQFGGIPWFHSVGGIHVEDTGTKCTEVQCVSKLTFSVVNVCDSKSNCGPCTQAQCKVFYHLSRDGLRTLGCLF